MSEAGSVGGVLVFGELVCLQTVKLVSQVLAALESGSSFLLGTGDICRSFTIILMATLLTRMGMPVNCMRRPTANTTSWASQPQKELTGVERALTVDWAKEFALGHIKLDVWRVVAFSSRLV